MSIEDGLVMQLHVGSERNHNPRLHARFGPDRGADIPVATEWTRSLRPLLADHGDDPRLRLVLFTLDESAYSRELAPLAGHYPAVYLGAPWWFHDSPEGIRRYLDRVTETAGFYNWPASTTTRAPSASIPARHDLWRRVTCDWLAGRRCAGCSTRTTPSSWPASQRTGSRAAPTGWTRPTTPPLGVVMGSDWTCPPCARRPRRSRSSASRTK